MATNPNTLAENVGRITAPDANYPYGSAKNDSTGTTGDGTPITEPILNDTYGLQQALLAASGIVPSGNADTAILSQYFQALVEQASGRAGNYDETGAADAYVAGVKANQQGPASYFDGLLVSFVAGSANTGAATVNVGGLGVKDIKMDSGFDPEAGVISGRVVLQYDGADFIVQETGVRSAPDQQSWPTVENAADSDHDIQFNAGRIPSADGLTLLVSTTKTKQIDASWVAGNNTGGLFSGTVTADTTYHLFVIRKDSSGLIDVGFDTDAGAANIPAGYTAYRRIASIITDGAANIPAFTQVGDNFILAGAVEDAATLDPGTAAVTPILSVPAGLNLTWAGSVAIYNITPSGDQYCLVTSPEATDEAPAISRQSLAIRDDTAGFTTGQGSQFHVVTDTSGRIRYRFDLSDATTNIRILTQGWIDGRIA